MSYMFYGAPRFNQPLDTWNTERVTDMSLSAMIEFMGIFRV